VRAGFDPDRRAPVDHNLPSLLGFAALLGAFAATGVAAWHLGGSGSSPRTSASRRL